MTLCGVTCVRTVPRSTWCAPAVSVDIATLLLTLRPELARGNLFEASFREALGGGEFSGYLARPTYLFRLARNRPPIYLAAYRTPYPDPDPDPCPYHYPNPNPYPYP